MKKETARKTITTPEKEMTKAEEKKPTVEISKIVKVRATVTRTTLHGVYIKGKEYEIDSKLADNFIKNGVAEKC